MYLDTLERMEAAGLEQYEISNVARAGKRSRHNLKYWQDGAWLGFGCGAHSSRDGWRWALAAALLFPATSLALVLGGTPFPDGVLHASSAPWCLGISLASALTIGSMLTAWLRRGAVTELNRAGWLTGLAAGGLGTFVYNLGCARNSVHYVALWYGLAVGISAVAGRLLVPRALRW